MIRLRFTPLALADLRRTREAIVAGHPDGPLAGEHMADSALARLETAIERLREFPRLGRPGHRPDILLLVVPGPTRHLTFTIGYRLAADHIAILGITWGGRRFPGTPQG